MSDATKSDNFLIKCQQIADSLHFISTDRELIAWSEKLHKVSMNVKIIRQLTSLDSTKTDLCEKLEKALNAMQIMLRDTERKNREIARQEANIKAGIRTGTSVPRSTPNTSTDIKPANVSSNSSSINELEDVYANRQALGSQSGWSKKASEGTQKSDYGKFKGGSMYSAADNARRKATNTGDVAEGTGKNVNVKAYSSKTGQLSAKQSAEEESKRYRQLNRKQPVRTFSPEEIATINEQRKKLASSIDIDAEHSEKIAKNEHEIANNLANLLKLNPNVSNRPTNDWIAEASKPISHKFSSEEEEMVYWQSIKVSDKDDGGYGY